MFDATWKAIRPSKSSDSGMKIALPPPPLPSEVFDSAEWYWYEGKRVRRAPRGVVDADEEDYDVGSHLNLGTETPLSGSMSPYPFPPSRGSVSAAEHRSNNEGGSNMTTPSSKLGPSARRNSLTSKKREADRDCGICLENAVKPCRARCCGKMFCSDHLNDWLGTSEHCPNCKTPLTLGGDNTIMLPSPLNADRSSETPKRATPRRGSTTPSASQSTPRSSSSRGTLFQIATPATDDSLSTGVPTPPPPYHLTGEDIELLAEELNLGSILSTSINGTDTPTVWTPTAFQKSKNPGSKRPGMFDAVFSSEKETLTTASRLATLVAFLLLLYVVLN